MNHSPSTWKAYLFLRQNRSKKKRRIYKMGFQTVIDKTTSAYLIVLFGYVFLSFFIFGDILAAYESEFIWIERQAQERLPLILTILPIRYITQSFRNPGVIFTNSEYQLSILPYSRKKLWLLTALEKVLKRLLIWSVIGFFVIILTPIASSVVISYILLFLFVEICMTIPQWKLFQQKWYIKLVCLIFLFILNGYSVLINSQQLIGIIVFTGIILINIWLLPVLFQRIKWSRVTEVSDFHVWNIKWIGAVSKTRFKRQRKFSIFQHLSYRKKPFTYTTKSIHNRIWQVYFAKNMELIVRLIGALLLMLIILPFTPKKILMFIGIAVAVFVYASSVASFFMDQFKSDIVEVLPWDLHAYKQSFFKWVVIGSLPIVICIMTYFSFHFTYWTPLQLFLIIISFMYMYHVQMNQSIALLAKKSVLFVKEKWYSGLAFLLIIGSGFYPILSCGALFFIYPLKQQIHAQVYFLHIQ